MLRGCHSAGCMGGDIIAVTTGMESWMRVTVILQRLHSNSEEQALCRLPGVI